MSTQQTAKTQYVDVNGVKLAYRRFGRSTGIPLVMHIHFRGTMDHWDPALINPLAEAREIILLDNSGVGKSPGEVPDNYTAWAKVVIDLVSALGIKKIDMLGFSMGGFVAQLVALNAPHLVRRLILAGTGPSAGEGVEAGSNEAFRILSIAKTPEEGEAAFLKTFYSLSEEKQALGRTWWKRINERSVEERADYLGPEGTQRQTEAVIKWASGIDGTYDRLGEMKIPVLVANGDNDIIIPTANSFVLKKRIPNAYLHIYPDTGHGFLFEYASLFSKHVNIFLDM
jgi:pimeloyl-ACP methyl ester carboxylesterase